MQHRRRPAASPFRVARAAIAAGLLTLIPALAAVAADPIAPGPPFPNPEFNRAVYDTAAVFSRTTVEAVETTIDEIEARTGAEVVVYTQVWPVKLSEEQTLDNARALMDQWGVGRKGFDDGLVILFDLDPSLVHGQVQLFAGSGFRSSFLTDAERQRIFDDEMLPRLVAGDLDGALRAAMARIDAAATTEHSRALELARQVNAVVGLVGGSLALLGLIGWAVFHWLRFGRDPEYTDSESVLVPAPPAGMTAATATMVFDGTVSRRTLTTALLDLASRGRVAFREEHGLLGIGRKLAIDLGSRAMTAAMSDVVDAERARSTTADPTERHAIASARLGLVDRRPLGPAETFLRQRLESIGGPADAIEPDDLPRLAEDVPVFDRQVEDEAVRQKWFAERPSRVTGRWRLLGLGEGIVGGGLIAAGFAIPMSGLSLLGGATLVAGVVTLVLAGAMPARTMAGAMQKAWLLAYRRTLSKTMEGARSMDQVVREAGLSWLETPDQAVVWATALGLSGQVEDVLERTMEDTRSTGIQAGYFPLWYRGSDGTSLAGGATGGGGGIFSSSGVPSIGGMMAAMGSIGSAATSSGSGGGGFGGGGGGGGGGAGGGF
ncbi:MAG TPA: TPM domain-containing protein [Candidatus Sulfomarinibacteraceae bacterium]|nr:TPM domain-containing protein [Candidatus Sulfomarinibacteraceae bacterium]